MGPCAQASFMVTASEAQLKTHFESKHAAKTFSECFPTYSKK